jgi:pimeloyl-ACP methyl ester carboxylesterase
VSDSRDRDRTVELHGQVFHYTEWGDPGAAPVVMLHGITGHARSWDDEAAALAERYHVLAFDQRGHGDSAPAPDGDYSTDAFAADLGAFLDALHLRTVHVVALSLGGRVAIAFAGRNPKRVRRLVIVDIGPDIAPEGRARVGRMIAGSPERFDSVEQALAFARAANPRYRETALRHRVGHGLRAHGNGFAWKYDREIREQMRSGRWRDVIDLWPLWAAIACPALIVRGAESDILSPEIAKRMLETQPHARLVEVENAGHTVPGDQPEVFLKIVRDFLAS